MLVKNQEDQENGLKSKKIVKVHAERKNGSKGLLKMDFLNAENI